MDFNELFNEGQGWTDWFFLTAIISTVILASLFGELTRHLYMSLTEMYRNKKESATSKMTVFKNNMSVFGILYSIIATICFVVVVVFSVTRSTILSVLIILAFVVSNFIMQVTGLWKPTPSELKNIYGDRLNFGYCFAWQFYLGYLKIILPDIRKRIREFEEEQLVEVRFHKLILLMPTSCQLVHDFCTHPGDENNIEYVKHLREVKIDRAGIKGRPYKNAVYCIKHDPEPIYCCVEGIAILTSLNDMKEKCGLSLQKKHQEFENFRTALKMILERDQLDHLVEMIIYEDKDDKGNHKKISEVIKNRMADMKQDLPLPV